MSHTRIQAISGAKKGIWAGLLLLMTMAEGFSQQPTFIRDSLETYIHKGMKDSQIPALAITIVKDGHIVLQKGYGVQQVDDPSRLVDENTLFLIASNTKLFTATALAQLEKDKKINLDESVLKYLPTFALYDTTATRLVTIRDLLSHRLGTSSYQGDLSLWDSNLSRQQVIHHLRNLPPRYPFRQTFGYANAAYVAAGEIIPQVTGLSWEQYVDKTILKPLGMDHTHMLTAGITKQPNLAYPYTTCCNSEGKLVRLPIDQIDNLGPAASMVSNVKDLTQWLLMQTDSGRVDQKAVLAWEVINKTRQANTIVSTQQHPFFPLKFQFYCLGTGLLDYAGHSAFVHTGGAFGYHSILAFVPELNLGLAILTNQDNNRFYEALQWQILDAYLKVSYTNRHEYFHGRAQARERKNQAGIQALAKRVDRHQSLPLPINAYTGTYANPIYGTIWLKPGKTNTSLLVKFEHHPDLRAQLDYMDNQGFRMSFSNPRWGITSINFAVLSNQVNSVEVRVSDFVDSEPYIFRKIQP